MSAQTVLVLGGTGRTGRRVVEQLLERDVGVRAIVRSPEKIPHEIADHPRLQLVEADLLSLTGDELAAHLRGCSAAISCLGHVISLKGVFGPPRDLVEKATRRLCSALVATEPDSPVRLVLMSSVSVNQPGRDDTRRGSLERAVLAVMRAAVPPARDNQAAADFLLHEIGVDHDSVQWVAVRPDTLIEGETSDYDVHPSLVASLFRPDKTRMANVAHFMCELVTDPVTWETWQGKLPVVVDVDGSTAPDRR